jgi:hypothetical protein
MPEISTNRGKSLAISLQLQFNDGELHGKFATWRPRKFAWHENGGNWECILPRVLAPDSALSASGRRLLDNDY